MLALLSVCLEAMQRVSTRCIVDWI
jgi:hypothetical protein